jgi:hypothetical protein
LGADVEAKDKVRKQPPLRSWQLFIACPPLMRHARLLIPKAPLPLLLQTRNLSITSPLLSLPCPFLRRYPFS